MSAEPKTSDSDAEAPQKPGLMSHRNAVIVYFGLLFAMLMATLDTTIVATSLPTIVRDLGGIDHIGWVSTVYILASSVATVLGGKLGDLLGRKLVFMVSVVLFLAGSATCGLAQSMDQLIAFRILQGIGAGGVMAAVFALAFDLFDRRELPKYQGYSTAVFALSAVAGPMAGGFFTDHLTWRWVFYVNLPIGAIALLLVGVFLKVSRRAERPTIDYMGMLLLTGTLVCLVLITNWAGSRYAWDSNIIIGLAVAGLILLVGWVAVERSASEAVIPLRLFRDSTFVLSNALAFTAGLSSFGLVFFLPLFLQMVSGVTATNSGLLLLPMMLGLMLTSSLVGRVVSKTGRYKWFLPASMLVLSASCYLLSTMTVDTSRVVSGLYMFLLGIGSGLSQQVVITAVQNTAPGRDMGAATSTVTFSRMLGASFGVSVFATILNSRLRHEIARYVPGGAPRGLGEGNTTVSTGLPEVVREGLAQAYAHSLSPVFLTAALIAVVAIVAALFVKDLVVQERSWGS
ncbi:MDR family MFS transporter, partial [Streptomyces sp. CT34]|uniref:MDR family MFS transporter n=1 Tax=Streptomyces sp. CT34 TaxID=1553907 RepID=UPI0005BB4000